MQYLQIYEREVMLVHLESVEAYIRMKPQEILGLSSDRDGNTKYDWMLSPNVYKVPGDRENQWKVRGYSRLLLNNT